MNDIMKESTITKFSLIETPTEISFPKKVLRNSKELNDFLKEIHLKEGNNFQEFFYVIFLNRANYITGYYLASMGGMTGTVADPKLILKAALLTHCTSIAISHNHPSGNLIPSKADEEITHKIKLAASYFDIKLLDHVIITQEEGYFSFADEGMI